jgi:hypothetical protein
MSSTLIMPFVDETEAFCNGFECGQIWEKIKSGQEVTSYPVHLENSAQIQMICDLYLVKCEIVVTSDEWGLLTVSK